MQIYGPSQLHGAQSINTPHISRAAQTASTSSPAGADRLELSDAAQFASQLNDVPAIRADRVAALKAAIADGSYETADKLSTAVSRLFDEIG
jgi:negative regulator of flagellin synthesis FlgM